MSEENNEIKEDHPINDDGKKVVGTEADVSRFAVGDLVRVHLEMKGQVFTNFPHEERGIVTDLNYEDDEYFFWMPVVQLAQELRMFNPDHLIVEQRADGSQGEVELLEAAKKATADHKAKEAAAENA